jgi:hypothetical protein
MKKNKFIYNLLGIERSDERDIYLIYSLNFVYALIFHKSILVNKKSQIENNKYNETIDELIRLVFESFEKNNFNIEGKTILLTYIFYHDNIT